MQAAVTSLTDTRSATPADRAASSGRVDDRGAAAVEAAIVLPLLLLLIFALQNLQVVSVSLIFVEMEMRLLWALLLFALIGAVIGLVMPRFWLRSRR